MILLVDICNEKLHYLEFVKPVEDILRREGLGFFTKKYKEVGESDLVKADKIIICGTSLKDCDFSSSKNLKYSSWIKDFNKPLLGICGGMQVIGLIFGGELKSKKEIGFYSENFEKNFLGIYGQNEVYHLHNNFVDFNKLKIFEIYSENKKVVQAVKHINKEIYGVLFHPEVRQKSMVQAFCKL